MVSLNTYRITDPDSGHTVKLTGESPPTEQELEDVFNTINKKTIDNSDIVAEKQATNITSALTKATGLEQGPDTITRIKNNVIGSIPGVSQFLGGPLAAAGTLALTKNPAAIAGASAVGGTLGRAGGRIFQQGLVQFLDNPLEATIRTIKNPSIGGIIDQMTPMQKKKFGEEIQSTAITEAVVAPIQLATGGLFKAFGKNFLKEVFGREVAERGMDKGFKKILKVPSDKVPVEVIRKTGLWIDKLLKVTGKGVGDAVEKQSDNIISTKPIKEGISNILEKGIKVNDLELSTAQKKLIKRATDEVMSLPENASIPQIWKARKNVDRIFYNNSFKKEGVNYLNKLRSITNAPIKNASDEIAASFGRYNNVRNAQTVIGNKMNTIEVEGLPFGLKVEKFAKSLLSGREDELTGFLKSVDEFLPAEDKVIEDLLDIGAAEALDSPIPGGFFTRLTVGTLGGKKAIASRVSNLQSKPIRALGTSIKRSIPTVISSAFSEFPEENK